ncbi:MAG: ABC transporter permease [Anaerolineae bacterium]|nr:ABC transporter permease [Anaerolineae bacterium]MEB2288583.1 ABC transporter permease [Anaerolineae bacterium]
MSAPRTEIAPGEQITLIKPLRGWVSLGLNEVWHYRELLFYFIWRDIKVRYKQTLLGAAWAILQPVFTMIVFSIFFGQLAKIPSDGIPYPIFSYAGLLPWTFFATGLTNGANSIVRDANLVKRVYFPRLITPISAVVGGLPDFFLAFLVLVGMMIYYGLFPTAASLLLLPLCLLLALSTSMGVGLWLSALNAEYRDVRYVVPFLTQFWMYATPVVYPSSLLDEPWRTLYGLNPMVSVVEGFRWSLLGQGETVPLMFGLSAVASLILLLSGAFFFRRMERRFADVV